MRGIRRRLPHALVGTIVLLAAGVVACGGPEPINQAPPQVEAQVAAARPDTPPPTAEEDTTPTTVDGFLDAVIALVHDYWTTTLTAAGLPEPSVSVHWLAPGETAESPCGPADEHAAHYCAADDTIYIGQTFGYEILTAKEGVAGDFGAALVVAHEYAHNVEHELGLYDLRSDLPTKNFELAADCFAGTWANSAYQADLLDPGDVEEAMATMLALGDFDSNHPDHHGTPEERQAAWQLGYDNGSPATCIDAHVPIGGV